MASRYQNGIRKACQWLSFASHQMFELSIEIALCDDKKENTGPLFKVIENQLEITGTVQNPYAEELNQLAVKIREKLDIIIAINCIDPFEIESWNMLDIFDGDFLPPKVKRSYHDLVRFCYQQVSGGPDELEAIINPYRTILEENSGDGRRYTEEEVLFEKTTSLIMQAEDDFKTAAQGFIMARYLAKKEGRIV